jgi:MFS family permease
MPTQGSSIRPRSWLVASVALNGLLAPLNSTMLLVALPDISHGLRVDAATTNWLVTAYLATMALSLAVGGRLGDRFGRRRVIFVGLVGHGLSSLIGFVAPEFWVLVLARVGMAASSAIVFPAGAAMVRQFVATERRGRAFGTVSAVLTLAAAVGPLVGGGLVLLDGWRTIFIANLPVVAAAFALSWWALPRSVAPATAERRSVLRLELLRIRPFAAAVGAIAFSNLAMYTTLLAIPVITAARSGLGSETRGALLSALSAGSVVFAPIGGRIADRSGRRLPAVAGMLIAAAGLALAAVLGGSLPLLAAVLALTGVGLGLSSAGMQTAAVEAVAPEDAGSAVGLYSTFRYLGGVAGTGVSAFVFAWAGPARALTPLLLLLALAALLAAAAGLGLPAPARSRAIRESKPTHA